MRGMKQWIEETLTLSLSHTHEIISFQFSLYKRFDLDNVYERAVNPQSIDVMFSTMTIMKEIAIFYSGDFNGIINMFLISECLTVIKEIRFQYLECHY